MSFKSKTLISSKLFSLMLRDLEQK